MEEFLELFKAHTTNGTFLKATLSKVSKYLDTDLKNCYLRPVLIKEETMIAWTFRFKTRDEVKNMDVNASVELLESYLGKQFLEAFLFTNEAEISLRHNKKGIAYLFTKKTKNQVLNTENQAHDRKKKRILNVSEPWLVDLKITNTRGDVLKNAQAKWRQINKFLETIESLLKDADLPQNLKVADMGSGKGYLTFALYTYLKTRYENASVVGIELRPELVEFCNKTAKKHGLTGLAFIAQDIADYQETKIEMLIALHACDTATDLAIAQGLRLKADVLVLAPCCHKQVRKEMEAKNEFTPLLKHGIFMERQAEMVTDGIRSLLLESKGYKTKVFEFISADHTAKNVMITANKRRIQAAETSEKALAQVAALKETFGINTHYLEELI